MGKERDKRPKPAMKAMEELYRLLFEHTGVALMFVAADTTITLVNREFETLTGYSREEVEGKRSWTEMVSNPDDLERMKTYHHLRRIDPAAAPEVYESRIRTRVGEERYVTLHVTMIPRSTDSLISLIDMTEARRATKTLASQETRLRAIARNIPGVVFQFQATDSGEYITQYASERLPEIFGLPLEPGPEFLDFLAHVHEEDRERLVASIHDAVAAESAWDFEGRFIKPSGEMIWFHGLSVPARQGDRLIFDGILLDITGRKQAEEAVEKRMVALTRPLDDDSGITFEELFDLSLIQRLQDEFAAATGVASIITRTDGTPITQPSRFCRLCIDIIRGTEKGLANCYRSDAALGRLSAAGPAIQPCMSGGLWDAGAGISVGGRHIANWLIGQVRDETQTEEQIRAYAREIGADEDASAAAFREVPAMSRQRFQLVSQALFTLANQLSTFAYQNVQQARFITERKRAEEERQKLQEQLLQLQKMEAVGRLAGGVAHDFNNMLGVILGQVELSLMKISPEDPLRADLLEIEKAARRSAELTRQLLAFARKQTIDPRVLDLNETVAGMLSMLRRLIGEDIELVWQPAAAPGLVKMDRSQIDQVLTNLCINARDAIANGIDSRSGAGRITIETGAALFDETYCRDHPGFTPGEFISLVVSDNGRGMDRKTLDNLFEPFFTTKATGRGTGLGLATVYGIVRQNAGFINVYSEPNQGTTFRIYLPRHPGSADPMPAEANRSAQPAGGGRETVLLVEDEPGILQMSRNMLEVLGYRVLSTTSPSQALRLADTCGDGIQLLMTDVVMPEMNGRELSQRLRARHPGLRRLFTSGYTANVIAHQGVLDPGVHFIQKPFTIRELAAKVREALGGEPETASPPPGG